MTSISQQLELGSNSQVNPILFSHQCRHQLHNGHNLTYKNCWQIVDVHQQWLGTVVDRRKDALAATAGNNDVNAKDVVIGYLADNSPDLLLSVLACMNLTVPSSDSDATSSAAGKEVLLPAMINCRWTPSEMERALRPNSEERGHAALKMSGVHVTVLLYGPSYERDAKEAVRLMNRRGGGHFAVALPLPEFAHEYHETNAANAQNKPAQEGLKLPNSINQQGDNDNVSDADALLLFTSGTSSPKGAKGVRLSHRSLLVQARAKTQPPCNYNDQTCVAATTVPWFHVGGMSSALSVLMAGGCLVFPPSEVEENGGSIGRKGFEPGRVLQSIQPHFSTEDSTHNHMAVNTLVVVPAMLHAIAEHVQTDIHYKNSPSISFANVMLILVGGQSIGNGRLYQQTRQLFPKARIVQTYACTEAGSSITFEDLGWNGNSDATDDNVSSNIGTSGEMGPKDELDGATCVGCPPPHIQIGIFDAKASHANPEVQSAMLPHGKMGIIGTIGPHVMSGYWNRGGGSNNATLSRNDSNNEWMITNDLGYIHPKTGKLFFCGRANDVIRTGGESVLATEVESVLGTHNNIAACAVFALPDEKFGEAVCAAIVLESTANNSDAGEVAVSDDQCTRRIRRYCADRQLAGFKRPRRVFVLQALPRNSSGKVLKHAIIKMCAPALKQMSRL